MPESPLELDIAPVVALVVSRYNRDVTDALELGAREAFERLAPRGTLTVVDAPGAFELPALAGAAAGSGRFHAVVCLGCVVKGETIHDQVIAYSVADALARLSCEHGMPVGLGVLTVDTREQAQARAGGVKGNKGAEAMEAALRTLAGTRSLANPVVRSLLDVVRQIFGVKPTKKEKAR